MIFLIKTNPSVRRKVGGRGLLIDVLVLISVQSFETIFTHPPESSRI